MMNNENIDNNITKERAYNRMLLSVGVDAKIVEIIFLVLGVNRFK